MKPRHFAIAPVALAVVVLGAAACTQPAEPQAAAPADTVTHTIVETREVAAPPVVVIDSNARPADQDSTTIRADQNGISVETRRH